MRSIHLEPQKAADRQLILSNCHPLESTNARIRLSGRRPIDFVLQCGDQELQRIRARPGHARRRHHAQPELADHLLRGLGTGYRIRDVEILERQVAGQQLVVVAHNAVALDYRGQLL